MSCRPCWAPVLVAVVATGALVVVAAGVSARSPPGTFSGCPRDTRPLPRRLAGSERAVRIAVEQFVRTSLWKVTTTPASELVGARVGDVVRVSDWLPSGWVRSECGRAVWRNSVAVGVYFPRLDKPHNPIGHCNACDRVTLLAARTTGGWTVWGAY